MRLNVEQELAGRYRMAVSTDPDGKNITKDTGWFDNLITDNGLEILGRDAGLSTDVSNAVTLLTQFYVGAGTTPPSAGDTSLVSLVASTSGNYATSQVQSSASFSDGYARVTLEKQFGEGVAAGNLSEIGIGPAANDLFSRALILDSEGDPTTLTVLQNEFLTVFYELRWNIPQTDQVFQHDVIIDGSPVTHDIVLRAAYANSASVSDSWGFALTRLVNQSVVLYNGALGAETSSPSGTSLSGNGAGSQNYLSYVPGSHERFLEHSCSISQGNLSGGISAIGFKVGLCAFQASFAPPLAKDDTKTLTIVVGWSWTRA